MLYGKNSFTDSTYKVAQIIFNNPTDVFYIRRLERKAGLSTTAIVKAVDILHKNKIIEVEKTKLTTNIKADLGSSSYNYYKRLYNLHQLKGLVEELSENNPKAIVLFGSASRGEDIKKSDIDILIIGFVKAGKFLVKYEKKLNRTINLHEVSLEKSSAEFQNAVANGIVLYGYIDIK